MLWDEIAEKKIRDAQAEGAFDHLPGFGQPIAGMDDFDNPLAWLRDKMRREGVQVLPPALEIALDVHQTLSGLKDLAYESDVRMSLDALNDRIRATHRRAIWGPPMTIMPLDIDREVARWKVERGVSKRQAG
jgi:hypothetical protein